MTVQADCETIKIADATVPFFTARLELVANVPIDRSRLVSRSGFDMTPARLRKFVTVLAIACPGLISPALGQQMQVPREVDYGASGLVQFRYQCAAEPCEVRCFINGTNVLEVKNARSATFTSYRSHGRQNAPEKEVTVLAASGGPYFVNFSGDGGCAFAGMKQDSTAGFLSRTTREK